VDHGLGRVREVTDASFSEDVLSSHLPVAVDFWAPWCRPCEALEPILARLESEHAGRLSIARMNVDENPDVAARYGVLSLPTTILFTDGEARSSVVGARSRDHYAREWAPWLTASEPTGTAAGSGSSR
jgi:thioredoxin 1